jgi:hypothetical protein
MYSVSSVHNLKIETDSLAWPQGDVPAARLQAWVINDVMTSWCFKGTIKGLCLTCLLLQVECEHQLEIERDRNQELARLRALTEERLGAAEARATETEQVGITPVYLPQAIPYCMLG